MQNIYGKQIYYQLTSIQDFFGGSIVEAIYCGCIPLLPESIGLP